MPNSIDVRTIDERMISERKVLIVDDERVIAVTLTAIFARAGYNCRAVYSAEEALRLFDDESWEPQFALLDVCLPGMHGIDLAILIRAKYPRCRILLFSGQPAAEGMLKTAQDSGHSFDILGKPAHPDELLRYAAIQPCEA